MTERGVCDILNNQKEKNTERTLYVRGKQIGTSWNIITIWLILFWPIGIYILLQRSGIDKSTIINGSHAPKIASGILFFASFSMFISPLIMADDGEPLGAGMTVIMIVMGIAFAIGGFLILKILKETQVLAGEFKKYLNIVVNGKVTNIEEIAKSTGVNRSVVEEKIQCMIDLHIFKGAYIDYTLDELVFGTKSIQSDFEYVNTVCPNCGAKQKIVKSKNNTCDYCRSTL